MHHCPGYVSDEGSEMPLTAPSHTAGLCCMQVDLEKDGTFVFTSDQFHVKENYTKRQPQGDPANPHLAPDHNLLTQRVRFPRKRQNNLVPVYDIYRTSRAGLESQDCVWS